MPLVPVVIENEGRQERSFDLYSRMLRERIVFLNGPVEDHMAQLICAQLLFLESVSATQPIHLYINSPGGVVTAGMAIYDTMNFIKPDVATLVMGQACSMGAFLLAAGAKGQRYALPEARIMIHQPSGGASGQATEMEINLKEILRMKERLTQITADNCGKDYETVLADMERDKFMSAEEAREYGLVDRVIKHRGDI